MKRLPAVGLLLAIAAFAASMGFRSTSHAFLFGLVVGCICTILVLGERVVAK